MPQATGLCFLAKCRPKSCSLHGACTVLGPEAQCLGADPAHGAALSGVCGAQWGVRCPGHCAAGRVVMHTRTSLRQLAADPEG